MKWSRGVYLILLVVAGFFMYAILFWQNDTGETIQINKVAELVQADQVEKIVVEEDSLRILLRDGTERVSYKEAGASTLETLAGLGVSSSKLEKMHIEVASPSWWGGWLNIPRCFAAADPDWCILLCHFPSGAGSRQPGHEFRQKPSTRVHR